MDFTHYRASTFPHGEVDFFEIDKTSFQLTGTDDNEWFILNAVTDKTIHRVIIFKQGWKGNWLSGIFSREEMRQEYGDNHFLCSVQRSDVELTFASADSNDTYTGNITIPKCLIKPMTVEMLHRGLTLPFPDDNTRQETLDSLLLEPRN